MARFRENSQIVVAMEAAMSTKHGSKIKFNVSYVVSFYGLSRRTCTTAKVMEHQTRKSAILKNELNIKGMHMWEIKTTVLQFMLESFIFFVFTNRDWVSYFKSLLVEVGKN